MKVKFFSTRKIKNEKKCPGCGEARTHELSDFPKQSQFPSNKHSDLRLNRCATPALAIVMLEIFRNDIIHTIHTTTTTTT